MNFPKSACIPILLLYGCIGIDYVDDPIVVTVVQISMKEAALSVGGEVQLEAEYKNQYGITEISSINWSSRNVEVATVDNQGKVIGVSVGQTYIVAEANGVLDSTMLTVVGEAGEVASILLTANKTELSIGESVQISFIVKNLIGESIPDKAVTFMSSVPTVLSVDQAGMVTGVGLGEASISASVDGVSSLPLQFIIGSSSVSGTFKGSSGYKAIGTAVLMRNVSNELILTFSSDFETSFALGTFVYLSNTTNGGMVRSQGLEIAEVTNNGAKTFNITMINSSVSLSTYKYVIILCKPASITFGIAELN